MQGYDCAAGSLNVYGGIDITGADFAFSQGLFLVELSDNFFYCFQLFFVSRA
jgi:hypothetical protein